MLAVHHAAMNPEPMAASSPILEVRDLRVDFAGRRRRFLGARARVTILERLNLSVLRGETLGLVGESGCGKTTLLMAILGLLPVSHGRVLIEGADMLRADARARRRMRRGLQVVFQNPFMSLDPRMNVLALISEPLRLHTSLSAAERRSKVADLLNDVGMPSQFIEAYPHELSGGQAQRVALARALALSPAILLLDEPTSSLDVSVQAQVLNLLVALREKYGLTYLFVSHDLGVIRHISDRIVVMYLGEVVEDGPALRVLANPSHPYTKALLGASGLYTEEKNAGLIGGGVPTFTAPPTGCRFHPRCPYAFELCESTPPQYENVEDQHRAACHLLTKAVPSALRPPPSRRFEFNSTPTTDRR